MAVGDALGAPVEFLSLSEIRAHYGEAGIADYVVSPISVRDAGEIERAVAACEWWPDRDTERVAVGSS